MRLISILNSSNVKVRGGALYLATMISIVVALILCMFLLLAKFNQRSISDFTQRSQLQCDLESGFELARSKYYNESTNNQWIKLESLSDSIKVNRMPWGAYTVLTVSAKNHYHKVNKSGLFGTFMSKDTAIYVHENGKSIGIAGKFSVEGTCYFPQGTMKPVFIEGLSYEGSAINEKQIKRSNSKEIKLDETFLNDLKAQYSFSENSDSMIFQLAQVTSNSFANKTVVYECDRMNTAGITIKNNVKIIVKNNCVIDSSSKIENAVIICKSAQFKKGFKGSVHVIASDSISVSDGCVFEFPSSFVLNASEMSSGFSSVVFYGKSCFKGSIIAQSLFDLKSSKSLIKLSKETEMMGVVFSGDQLHLEGNIIGNVYTKSLIVKTASAYYENHLMNCELNSSKYSSVLCAPRMLSNSVGLIKCKDLKS
ncbi:MAG: hypothetical protein ACK50A_08595 [Sphingobacteriaceae bacterium]